MKIKQVVFGEDIIELPDSQGNAKIALINPTGSFTLNYIPSAFSFSIMVMLQGASESNTNLSFVVKNPRTNRTVFNTNATINPLPNLMSIPDSQVGLNLNLNLKNIEIEDPGDYIFEVAIEGEETFSETIPLLLRPKKE